MKYSEIIEIIVVINNTVPKSEIETNCEYLKELNNDFCINIIEYKGILSANKNITFRNCSFL